jgi:hypothetical protein
MRRNSLFGTRNSLVDGHAQAAADRVLKGGQGLSWPLGRVVSQYERCVTEGQTLC